MRKKINNFNNIRAGLLMLVVLASTWSCTYDYFVNENNFRVYVPQLVEGSIDNVLVSVHDSTGAHMSSVFLQAPFDTYGSDGYISFKLPVATGYKVSCFAQIDPDSYSAGQNYNNSYITEPASDSEAGMFTAGPDFRVLLFEGITAYPLNYQEEVLVADLNEETARKAGAYCRFIGLPSNVASMDIYLQVSTKMYYDGIYRRDSGAWVKYTHEVENYNSTNYETEVIEIFASAGTHYSDSSLNESGRELVDIYINYYDENGNLVGRTLSIASGSDIPAYDEDGNDWDRLLDPNMLVCFVFQGFTLTDITLQDWEDIIEGGTTLF